MTVDNKREGEEVPGDEAKQKKEHYLKIIDSHLDSDHQENAVKLCIEAVEAKAQLKDIAQHVKLGYDKLYPGSGKATEGVFHCIVGNHFASCVSHETRMYIHVQVDTLHIIMWKSKDSPFMVSDEKPSAPPDAEG